MWLLLFLSVLTLARSDWNIQEHLGTKTPYWSQNSTTSSPAPPGCSPVHVNLVSRHGSRYPTKSNIVDLINLEAIIKNYSVHIPDTFAWIKNWTNPYPLIQQGSLSNSGQEELFHMAQRFNSTYFPLFSQLYYPDVYVMQSTQIPRAGVSASSFAQGYLQGLGLLGSSNFQPPYIWSDTPSNDVLRFFDNCPAYTQAQDNGTLNEDEADTYSDRYYPAIAQRVSSALGLAPYWNASIDQLDTMFTACAFEVAVFNKTDGWCSVFSPDDISVFEYASDLGDYWVKSYGSGLGYQIGAVVLQSIVSTMDGVISKSLPTQKAYLQFAHAETVMPLSALLGLYRDDYVLTANLTPEQIENRKWSTSFVSPFAANLAFALYQCEDGYRVKLTANEVETHFPGCADLYCPYTQFKSLYAQALAFNFTQACALKGSAADSEDNISSTVLVASIFAAFVVGVLLALIGSVVYIRKQNHKYTPLSG